MECNKKHIDKLKSNFLFQISLASKELFHSNLLAWILEQKVDNREYVLKFFLELIGVKVNKSDKISELIILRESFNLDLLIKCKINNKESIIAIENKIKSVPTSEQLKNYDKLKDVKTASTKRFLLTLLDSEIETDWSKITYRNHIIPFLSKLNDIPELNPDLKFVTEKYIRFLDNLDCISNNCIDNLESRNYDFYTDNYNDLKYLRIHDLFLKYAHSKISDLIKEQIKPLNEKFNKTFSESFKDLKNNQIYISSSFSNSTGISDIKICIAENFIIGIQLQGKILRYYTEVVDEEDIEKNIKFAQNLLINKLWFVDRFCNNNLLLGNGNSEQLFITTGENRAFCTYDKGLFIYLYKDIKDYNTKPIRNLVDFIVNEIQYVYQSIDEIRKCSI